MTPDGALQSFFAMGGYGGFVWPAYGVTALVLIALLVASLRGLRRRQAELDRVERERGAGQPRRSRAS